MSKPRYSRRPAPAPDLELRWMLDEPEADMQETLFRIFRLDPRTCAALWQARSAEILPLWVSRCPGTRPKGWWRHVAPERRPAGESEPAYLLRLGLLLPGELERIPATAWESAP